MDPYSLLSTVMPMEVMENEDMNFLELLQMMAKEEEMNNSGNISYSLNDTLQEIMNKAQNSRITNNPEKILALILGIISILANVFSLLAITKIRGRLTANLRLIVSLCIGDILGSLSILLYISHSEISMMFEFGDYPSDTCFLTIGRSLRMTAHVISLLNLVGLALDHYFAILRPLDYPRLLCRSRANGMIVTFWIVAFLCGFSNFYILLPQYAHCEETNNFCTIVFCNIFDSEYIMFAMAIISFFLMSSMYARIYIEINRYQSFQSQHRQNMRRNRRGLVTTFFIVLTFLLCWLPYSLFEVIVLAEMTIKPDMQFYYFKLAAKIDTYLYDVLLLNSLCDPIIYALRMREVQHGYKNSIQVCLKKKQNLTYRLRGIDPKSSMRVSTHTMVMTSIGARNDSFL